MDSDLLQIVMYAVLVVLVVVRMPYALPRYVAFGAEVVAVGVFVIVIMAKMLPKM